MNDFWLDLHRSLRSLVRQPMLSLVVVLTLATGFGAATAMFSFLSELIFDKAFHGPDRARTFFLYGGSTETPRQAMMPHPDFEEYRRSVEDVAEVRGWIAWSAVARLEGEGDAPGGAAVLAFGEAVHAGHFKFFDAPVALGRGIQSQDEAPGSPPVVVLDERFWQRQFDGDPSVVGRTLRLAGHPFTIIGIGPADFQGQGVAFNLYIPLIHADLFATRPALHDRTVARMRGVLELREGVVRSQVEERLRRVAEGLDREFPLSSGGRREVSIAGVEEGMGDVLGNGEWMLIVAVVLLLVLAVVNVANLMLVRADGRLREMAVFSALGAGRWRLTRRLLMESVYLGLAGGGLGTLLAVGINSSLRSQLQITPVGLGGWAAGTEFMPIDVGVVLFTAVLSVLVGLVFGLVPVARVLGSDLMGALKGGGGGESPRRRASTRHALVVVQVAISTALLVAAGLLSHSLVRLQQVDPGFETEHLLLAALRAVPQEREDPAVSRDATRNLYRQAQETVAALPGVEAVTLVSEAPGSSTARSVTLELPEWPGEQPQVTRVIVGLDFFETLQVEVLRGRTFRRDDRAGGPGVVIVNEAFVENFWPTITDPSGRTLRVARLPLDIAQGSGPSASTAGEGLLTVIGLVRDSRQISHKEPATPVVYLPFAQAYRSSMTLMARTDAAPESSLAPVRQALVQVDPDLAVVDLGLHRRHFEFDLFLEVIFARLARLFAFLGLALAATGIYSLLSALVSARRRELGIRMAVGATSRDVVRRVLGESMVFVAAGIVGGLIGSLWLGQFLESLLFGVSTSDPTTFVAVSAFLAAVALMASWLPAWRAGRVDPLTVLREE